MDGGSTAIHLSYPSTLHTHQIEGAGLVVKRIRPEDESRVLEFLKRFFFKDEPLNIAVGLLDEPGSTCVELERYCLDTIPHGVSVLIEDQGGEVVAACLNSVMSRPEANHDQASSEENKESKEEHLSQCANPKFAKILGLLARVCRESDVFGQFPEVNQVLDVSILSVDPRCRGQGLAKRLIHQTIELAGSRGIPLVRMDCSSHYSGMAAASLGFRPIYSLKYADHLDSNGHPVFLPEPPHTACTTYVIPTNNNKAK